MIWFGPKISYNYVKNTQERMKTNHQIILYILLAVVGLGLAIIIIWCLAQFASLFRDKPITKPHPKQSEFPIPLSNQNNQKRLCHLMSQVDNLLKKHKIDYWIIGGTCLGAVRHKGMIPWDDDVDIAIIKEDEANLKSDAMKEDLRHLGLQLRWIHSFGYKIVPTNTPLETVKFFVPKYFPFIDIFIMKKTSTPEGRTRIIFDRNVAHSHLSKEWFYEDEVFPTKKMKFGSFTFQGPCQSEEYLTRTYGKDWADRACYEGRHGQIWHPKKCFLLESHHKNVCGC